MKVKAKPLLLTYAITVKVDQTMRNLLESLSCERQISISDAARLLMATGAEHLKPSQATEGENA